MKKLTRTGSVVVAVLLGVVAAIARANEQPPAEQALAALLRDAPGAVVYESAGRVAWVGGRPLTFGTNAEEAVELFRWRHAGVFGVEAADLRLIGFGEGDAGPQPVLFRPETGDYAFTLYRYGQYQDGIPVFRAELRVLVRNDPDYPVVLATSSLRSLGGFAPNRAASKGPVAVPAFGVGQFDEFSTPQTVIWAGVEDMVVEPLMAYTFIAERGQPQDGDYAKWLYVVEAMTGRILFAEDQIIFTNVTGNVSGMATTSDPPSTDLCNPEVSVAMPYARARIIGGNQVWADANGNFTIPNPGTSSVTVESQMNGLFFTVDNAAGEEETLSMAVTPPGPANFLHNAANTDELVRAQVNGYVQANVVRDFCLTYNPAYPTIVTQTNFPVYVNRTDGSCPGNAWYAGGAISFCQAANGWPNTAYSGVVHHEYGHHIVHSGGSGQGAYGEGMSDSIALLIADDPILGYGFTGNCNNGIRNADNTCQYLAPPDCSTCGSGIHVCGQLLSGCIWSTRNELAFTNPATYLQILSALTVNSILLHLGTAINAQITTDFLTLDDNDSNLLNGTPHWVEICTGFGAHGLACPPLDVTPPAITCSASGANLGTNCQAAATFSATVTDDMCVRPDGVSVNASLVSGSATIGTPVVNFTQTNYLTISVSGSVTVSNVTACPVIVEIVVNAVDWSNNAAVAPCAAQATVNDTIAPTLACAVTNAVQPIEVDANCQATVDFSVTVTDNCCVDPADVAIVPSVTSNATLGTMVLDSPPPPGKSVTITGHVPVSNLTSCLATVTITATAADCCGVPSTAPGVDQVDVVDKISATITCPPDITLEHGSHFCDTAVQDWLDSATAADNCDPNPVITNDAPPCGFPYGSSTLVTWTATDACNNSSQCSATITIKPAHKADTTKKGSLLVWPHVEIKWNATGQLVQETFLTLVNDLQSSGLAFKLYFVNGNCAAAGDAGCNFLDNQIDLTHDQSVYWAASTGNPAGVSPFTALDPDGCPDTDPRNPGGAVLHGFVVGWAVNAQGHEIRWNHLRGGATIVNYADHSAWDYDAYALTTRCVDHGAEPRDCTSFDANGACCTAQVIPGKLDLDGFQYDRLHEFLLLDFFAAGSTAFGPDLVGNPSTTDTRLSLLPMVLDFSADRPLEPVLTNALIDVWNADEVKLTSMQRCVECWDSTMLSDYTLSTPYPNHFLLANLGSDNGKARIKGTATPNCDRPPNPNGSPPDPGHASVSAPLLAVAAKLVEWSGDGVARAGGSLSGLGDRTDGVIEFDVQGAGDPPELRHGYGIFQHGAPGGPAVRGVGEQR